MISHEETHQAKWEPRKTSTVLQFPSEHSPGMSAQKPSAIPTGFEFNKFSTKKERIAYQHHGFGTKATPRPTESSESTSRSRAHHQKYRGSCTTTIHHHQQDRKTKEDLDTNNHSQHWQQWR